MDALTLRVTARYKSKTVSDEGNTIYLYSEGQIAKRNTEKAKRLEALRGDIEKLRKQVKKDLTSDDQGIALTALAVALIDETYERVGNPESADDGHYGVTGWTKDHITFGKGKATIKYVGKSGVKHEKYVEDAAVVKALKKAYDACDGDCIFSPKDGGKVSATKVNEYLKEFDVTAKDLRGFHANRTMKEELQKARKGKLPEDKKEREKKLKDEFKAALEATAEAVGHEPATLKGQYLVPGLEEAYIKDGTVTDKMTKTAGYVTEEDLRERARRAELSERVAMRYAVVVRLDLAWLDGLRKDFLTLMKNLPRVKDYATGDKLRTAFRVYQTKFHDLFFDRFIKHTLKYELALDEGSVQWYTKKLSEVAWSFRMELMGFPLSHPNNYKTEEGCFAEYEQKSTDWKNRMTRRAQAFWKEMKVFIESMRDNRGRTIDVKVPTVENAQLEGFKLVMKGFEPGDQHHEKELETLREGLKIYRQRASKVAPILLRKQIPVIIEFETTLDKGGEYDHGGFIIFYASSATKGPERVAHTMAHEMGHHIFQTYLGSAATEQWYALIRGDVGDLDLKELLDKWPGDTWAFQFPEVMGKTDPILALQVDAVSHDRSFVRELQQKQDFQKLYDEGTRVLKVPMHPITGYANKNPEEAFCETIGLLVAHGPNALHEKVRWWINMVMPGDIKVASGMPQRIAQRYLLARYLTR